MRQHHEQKAPDIVYFLTSKDFVGDRLSIWIQLMRHLASGMLVMLLALAPAVAEEPSTEKSESIERYLLVDEQVAAKIKSNSNKPKVPSPSLLLSGFSALQGANNHAGQTKLFILYHNLKLCD